MKRSAVIAMILALVALPMGAGPVAASGGGSFECTGAFPTWPITGPSGAHCRGTATGVFQDGPRILVCIPACSFDLRVDAGNSVCVGGQQSVLTSITGTVVITDGSNVLGPELRGHDRGHRYDVDPRRPHRCGQGQVRTDVIWTLMRDTWSDDPSHGGRDGLSDLMFSEDSTAAVGRTLRNGLVLETVPISSAEA